MCFINSLVSGQEPDEIFENGFESVDTVYITSGGYKLHFSDSIFNMSYIRYLGRGMRCIDPKSFTQEHRRLRAKTILSNLHGVHEISSDIPGSFKMNEITWDNVPFVNTDASVYHTDAVIFDSYFEDIIIEPGDKQDMLILNNTITYMPDGYAKYEVIYIRKQPYVIIKSNIGGILYTEWFRFGDCNQKPSYIALKYTSRGIGLGVKNIVRGVGFVGKHMIRGALIGTGHTVRGVGTGIKTTTSIGRYIYNESKMFYKPSPDFEDMGELVFEEKPVDVEKGITIHNYYFECDSPKANIFLVHGNGGNVSTYKTTISALLEGNYNVCVVDWRGYGKSTGKPDYKGVLKDTKAAFDDFLSTRHDSLKVIVFGMSLGGQIAAKLVSDRQQDVDALVLDGSLSSAQNLALDFIPTFILRNEMRRNADVFNQEYIAERDIKTIENIPKLIIHSETDRVVALYHGKRLFKNAQEPKFFWQTNTQHIRTFDELAGEAIGKIDLLINHTGESVVKEIITSLVVKKSSRTDY
ncbi:MAG: lysophospholipase [Tannerella sp.]|nr:lysophospholipase [Tannerella sp.]